MIFFYKKRPTPKEQGEFLAFSLSQLIKQPSRLRRPWRMLQDRRRQDETACSLHREPRPPVIRMLSPPRLVNTSRSGSHGLRLNPSNAKVPCRLTGRGQFLAFSLSQLIKQPSRLRRPWRMLQDRRRPYRREPCGSSGCWPWKACK